MEYTTRTSKDRVFKIIKAPNDPACLRVSLGGTAKDGYYLVFRGDISEVEEMINEAQAAFSKAKQHYISQNN